MRSIIRSFSGWKLIYGLKSVRENLKSRRSPPEFGGSPPLQQGALDFSPAETRFISQEWALAPGSRPALKRMIEIELFPATLKRCFPLLKQRAPTKLRGEIFPQPDWDTKGY